MSFITAVRFTGLRLLPVAILSVTAACVTAPPTPGDLALAQGKEVSDLGKQWNRGTEMVDKGNDLVKKGKNQIKDGEENLEEGHALIKKGQALIAESEAAMKVQQVIPDTAPAAP